MTTAEMVKYAYDEIDQARAALNTDRGAGGSPGQTQRE